MHRGKRARPLRRESLWRANLLWQRLPAAELEARLEETYGVESPVAMGPLPRQQPLDAGLAAAWREVAEDSGTLQLLRRQRRLPRLTRQGS